MKKYVTALVLGLSVAATALSGCAKQLTATPYKAENKKDVIEAEKPVIYLYGYDNEKVNVKLELKNGELTCTYPKYDEINGWNVTAKKDSTLVDDSKQTYSYLYWEGRNNISYNFDKGFCVKGSETAAFLEKELKNLGLTRKEADEFIVYWLPRMEKNNYNIISFQSKAYTDNVTLTVEPAPDKTFRVFMAWYSSNEPVDIQPQSYKVPSRAGNSKILVEWGGAEVEPSEYKAKGGTGSPSDAERIEAISDSDIVKALTGRSPADIQVILSAVVTANQLALFEQANNAQGTAANAATAAGHPFTDKNGATTTFTNEEWEKLKAVWSYTGNGEEMISHHTIGELRSLLKK